MRLLALFLCSLLPFAALGQAADHPAGQVIAMLQPGYTPDVWQQTPLQAGGQTVALSAVRTLSARLRIYLLHFDPVQHDETAVLQALRRRPEVQLAQFNHYVQPRHAWATFPLDPDFGQQWDMHNTGQSGGLPDADIDAPEAWDITTGGLTALGDTLVVAVIDGGADLAHPDLALWKNHAEIPGNGLDDDANGYIDDYHGWNAYNSNGNLPPDDHGTHVAGTIGARGDNGLGVAGVNWHMQVMPIAGFSGLEATVVEAYGYALEMRTRYNQSGGTAGALVVATNSSFGVDFGRPADYPIWCAMYDSLGAAGILSAGATMNVNANVDVADDIPTACPSPWMISVTNTTRQDQRNTGSAYGLTTIDLGAPGTDILSTIDGGGYSAFTGTSMATPHVAGAIALLLSAPCPGLAQRYRVDPAGTALLIRDYLLAGVDTIPALQGITVTGGRLNIHKSLLLLMADCGTFSDCLGVTGLQAQPLTDTSTFLAWTPVDSALAYNIRYRPVGDTAWRYAGVSLLSQFQLDSLSGCTPYEVQAESVCDTATSGYLTTAVFTSQGCCEAPVWTAASLQPDSTRFAWPAVYGADTYEFRYRPLGDTAWTGILVGDTSLLLGGLAACQGYAFQIRTNCGKEVLPFSPIDTFYTDGCGVCTSAAYCPAGGSTLLAWVRSVALGDLVQTSGNNGGYAAFNQQSSVLYTDSTYLMRLVPGTLNPQATVVWRVWIDFGRDGSLGDPGDLVLQSGPESAADTFAFPVSLPAGTGDGPTLLRVAMKLQNSGVQVPPPCGELVFGEVEDYCVWLTAARPCQAPAQPSVVQQGDSLAPALLLQWASQTGQSGYDLRYRVAGAPDWTPVAVAGTTLLLDGLLPCTRYEIQVRSLCSGDSSAYGEAVAATTTGCGACIDRSYCASGAAGTSFEWIERLRFDSLLVQSGPDQGYGDYAGQVVGSLAAGDSLWLEMVPGFGAAAAPQQWRVFADWNQDGDFGDAGELALAQGGGTDSVAAWLRVPATALAGIVRLRVVMQRHTAPAACGSLSAGETEDYCLAVQRTTGLDDALGAGLRLYPQPAEDRLVVEAAQPFGGLRCYDLAGRCLLRLEQPAARRAVLDLASLPEGVYVLQVQTPGGIYTRRLLVRRP